MTRSEFNDWFDHHCSRFTGVDAWLSKFPEIGSGATQKSILDGWYLVVSGLTLMNATWATDQMFAAPTKPRSFDDHPARIVELNRQAADGHGSRASSRESTDRRCVCEGTGFVEVANDGQFVTLSGQRNPRPYVIIACRCSMGQWINARRAASPHPEFGAMELPIHDPEKMRLGRTVRAEAARVYLDQRGLRGMSFAQQIARVLGQVGAMPRDSNIAIKRAEAVAALSAQGEECDDRIEGVPF